MTKVISPQFVLVDGVPRHIKDLRQWHSLISLEEDSDGTPSESKAESLLCDTEDTESDDSPDEEAVVEPSPVPLRRSTRQKRPQPDCHICDHEIRGECSKRRNLPPGSKCVRLCLACQAVENIFTSKGHNLESHEKKHTEYVNFLCRNLHKRACQQQEGGCCSLWKAFWLTEQTNWPEVYWGRAARHVCCYI